MLLLLLFACLSYASAATRSQKMPNAWNIEYIGNCHHLLLDYIKSASKVGDSESNSVTILQSSGTGKSRMVHELSDLVFTIPFKLHESTSYDSEEGHEGHSLDVFFFNHHFIHSN